MLTQKPHRKDGTGQRTWLGLSLDVCDVESLLFFFFAFVKQMAKEHTGV